MIHHQGEYCWFRLFLPVLKLKQRPSRALNLALFAASGTSKMQGDRHVWSTKCRGPGTPSASTDPKLWFCVSKTLFLKIILDCKKANTIELILWPNLFKTSAGLPWLTSCNRYNKTLPSSNQEWRSSSWSYSGLVRVWSCFKLYFWSKLHSKVKTLLDNWQVGLIKKVRSWRPFGNS